MSVHERSGMGITVRDIAKHAEVSSGTVSRVLNGANGVDAELRRRVLASVDALGYVPGRSKARVAAGMLGFLLVLRDVEEGAPRIGMFWADILHGAEKYARGRGGDVVFRSLHSHISKERLAEQVADLHVPAALLVGPADEQTVNALTAAGLRLVLVDNALPGSPCSAVLSDNFGGAMTAVNHLLDLGHRDIAFVGGPRRDDVPGTNSIYSIRWRAMGYRTALRERGVPIREELVESCDLTSEGGADAARRLLAAGRLTAVFCANDPTANGVLRALREEKIDVPKHVSVVGFDDDMAYNSVPPLTTLRVAREAMGAVAVKTVFDDEPSAPPLTMTLPVDLVVRASTAPPPRR